MVDYLITSIINGNIPRLLIDYAKKNCFLT